MSENLSVNISDIASDAKKQATLQEFVERALSQNSLTREQGVQIIEKLFFTHAALRSETRQALLRVAMEKGWYGLAGKVGQNTFEKDIPITAMSAPCDFHIIGGASSEAFCQQITWQKNPKALAYEISQDGIHWARTKEGSACNVGEVIGKKQKFGVLLVRAVGADGPGIASMVAVDGSPSKLKIAWVAIPPTKEKEPSDLLRF